MGGLFGKLSSSLMSKAIIASALTTTSICLPTSAIYAQEATSFPQWDDSDKGVRLVRAGAAQASRDRLAIVVWGGTAEIQRAAYRGALDLHDEGVPLSFILGPDHDGNTDDALIDVYVLGRPGASMVVWADTPNTRTELVEGGRKMYRFLQENRARR